MHLMHYLFSAIIYKPLYNGLIFLIAVIPFHNVGLVVILFTCLIKVILFPLSQKAVKTQLEMKRIEGEMQKVKEQYKDDKKLQASKTMELYKTHGVNPFSGIFLMLIQLPVLMALYYIFLHAGFPDLSHVDLYSFTKLPDTAQIGMEFFGVNVMAKSWIFALLAAVSQFFQMRISLPAPKQGKSSGEFKDELAKSMNVQMKYVMPVIIFFIARSFPVVVSLYLITSSVFTILQEIYTKRKSNPQIVK